LIGSSESRGGLRVGLEVLIEQVRKLRLVEQDLLDGFADQ
jgi:hypothetical protein